MHGLHFKLNQSTFAEQIRKSSQFHFNVLKMQTIILLNFGCTACTAYMQHNVIAVFFGKNFYVVPSNDKVRIKTFLCIL